MMFAHDAKGIIAGAILLAAPSGQFVDVMVEQQQNVLQRMETLALPEHLISGQKQTAAMVDAAAKTFYDTRYSAEQLPPITEFPFQPAYWWFEQKGYVPAEVAAGQTRPLLILQGENDWQVSMEQFKGWKEALKNRSDVSFISYPKLNHLLTEYDGLSVGMEYSASANVAPAVIEDMAEWIRKRK